ncbi:MAG: hypothetical protein K2Y22_06225 [Candidatus Obscuribacterales bacterium]|nr:hypothetical protein [Candidatus Obscuribacterales bacterium]
MIKVLGVVLIVAGVTTVAVAVRAIQNIIQNAADEDDQIEPAIQETDEVEDVTQRFLDAKRLGGNVDAYLAHQIAGSENPNRQYPFLMRVKEQFDAKEIPGLSVSSKIGDVWACRATLEAIDLLSTDPRVLCIEGSPRGHLE